DVLDDLSKPVPKPTSSSAIPKPNPNANPNATQQNETETDEHDVSFSEEFASELAAGMEELMKEMESSPELKNVMERIMGGFDNQTTEKNESEKSFNEAGSFQDKINETLNKLKNSSDQVEAELGDPNSMEALMEQMFSQMDGLADSDEFQNVLEGMMQQLMSREILYEPLKDLAVKYPEYLSNNKSSIPEEDYKRYTEQHGIVQQIVTIYNSTSGREETEAESKQVVDLLQKMQDCGQPPPELLKSLAPDMEIDPKTGLP
ncbi:Pex19 protein, partial [Paraphysoderma sedebokerense]